MSLLSYLKNLFGIYPKTPNEFVKKFLKESEKSRVQLEMIYNREIILQVDSLKFVPSWFKVADINPKEYKEGYVVFFILNRKDLEENDRYQRYKKSNLRMIEIKEKHGQTDIVTFAQFLNKNSDYMDLAKYMRNVIDNVYVFREKNPPILFNLRYLPS